MGFRDVTVTTDFGGGAVESALGVGAFNVIATPTGPTVTSVSPTSAALGSTLDVTIRGVNTNFTAASVPLFCVTATCSSAGNRDTLITVNTVTATSATTLVANITIASGATVAYRSVSVVTGAEVARETVTGPFLVTATQLSIPRLTSVSPQFANAGQTLTLNVVGQSTTFTNAVSALSVSGAGITVNNTVVTSATTLSANITIAAGAVPGFRDVFVITGGETAALLSGFNIIGGPPTAQPPTGLYAASVTGNLVTLRWNAPLTGLVPTNFVLAGGVLPAEVLASIPTNSAAPIFTFVAPTGLFVRMHTVSGVEQSGPSNEIQIARERAGDAIGSGQPRGRPETARASGSPGAIPTEAEKPSAMLLDVSGSFTGTLPLPMGDSFSFDAVPGGTYTVSLRAANAAGVSPSSNPVTLSFPGACANRPLTPVNFLGLPDWQHRLRRLGSGCDGARPHWIRPERRGILRGQLLHDGPSTQRHGRDGQLSGQRGRDQRLRRQRRDAGADGRGAEAHDRIVQRGPEARRAGPLQRRSSAEQDVERLADAAHPRQLRARLAVAAR